ncbi:MAG: response regulator [SAR202 cluster bacterium]|nr:response regulator [SAR202 cluster bacterium]
MHTSPEASPLVDQLATARKRIAQLESQLAQASRAAGAGSAAQARFKATLDQLLEGCQIIGFDFRYLYVNDAVARHGRRTREELIGHTMMEVYPGIDASPFFTHLKRCLTDRTPHRMVNEFTFPDGAKGWFELSIQPAPEGVFILSVDVSARHQAETALVQSNRDLKQPIAELRTAQSRLMRQERLSAIGKMAGGIAHDFNNNLMPVLGYTELLLTDSELLDDREKVLESLRMVNSAARNAASTVVRLRELYKPSEENENLAPFDVNGLVRQVVVLTRPKWREEAQARGAHIEVLTDLGVLRPLNGLESELRDVLTNMVFNAVDAMPDGGTIVLSTKQDGDHIAVAVKNTGAGMTDEVRRRCMEPLFTTKGNRGTGLGLAVAHTVVQRRNGTIDIQSAPGKGTTIQIRLPLQAEPAIPALQPAVHGATRRLHALVVDDEYILREVVAAYLTIDRHTYELAANGMEALEKFKAGHFDIVITDMGMSELSGDELASAIKQIDPNQPIVMITGFGEMLQAVTQRPTQADLVVPKPFTLAQLREAMWKVTNKE